MPRIRRHMDRKLAMHADVELMAAKATGHSEPGPKTDPIGVIVWDDDKVPRVPFIGAHAGAIDGTIPHRNGRLDRWTPKKKVAGEDKA